MRGSDDPFTLWLRLQARSGLAPLTAPGSDAQYARSRTRTWAPLSAAASRAPRMSSRGESQLHQCSTARCNQARPPIGTPSRRLERFYAPVALEREIAVAYVRITLVPSRRRPVRAGSHQGVRAVAEAGTDERPREGVNCRLLTRQQRVRAPRARPVRTVDPVPQVHRMILAGASCS